MKEHDQDDTKHACCSSNHSNKTEASTDKNVLDASCEAEPVIKSGCCAHEKTPLPEVSNPSQSEASSCCAPQKNTIDWIMWVSSVFCVVAYSSHLLFATELSGIAMVISHTSFEMLNTMWWGILAGAFAVGLLGRIPNQMIMSVLGRPGSKRGIVRATIAGLLLDLCNHGILMVAMGLYRKGASLGQVMAFLIASPWNSFTLTLILVALIGLPYTLMFIVGSMVIAWISGLIFDRLVVNGVLPGNPAHGEFDANFKVWPELKGHLKKANYSPGNIGSLFWQGLKESKMVVRWVLFGVLLVSLVRAFVDPSTFGQWFGASVAGLFMTLLVTTLIEVCSEGSSPIAADLVNRAGAPGNGFVFLMAGAATDYTEIMALKDTTASWKIALFLPLVTVPQVLLIGWLLNQ